MNKIRNFFFTNKFCFNLNYLKLNFINDYKKIFKAIFIAKVGSNFNQDLKTG